MKSRSLLTAALSLACVFAVAAAVHAADSKKPKPDATIKLVSKSIAAGAGISWGSGKLMYKGKSYDIDVQGLTVGSVGVSSITATGKVYNLSKIEDFDGNYTAAAAGITIAGGTGGTAMQNQNGVQVRITATTKGVSLTLGASGVTMTVKK
ncbi:MAG TPA: EipA family protein [Myxococcota bacterium]|nr:EipA family protein [Myxococcota bacterium]